MSSQGDGAGPSQPSSSQSQSQSTSEKLWQLKHNITMTVGAHGKKTSHDKFMTLDLIFRFEDDPNPKLVGTFVDIELI